MLTARRLYQADTDVQTYANILARTGVVVPSRFAPQVSPALNRVVLQGLQARPADRFATAREMARALQRATPIASPSDVGDWVQTVAGEALRERARKVAAIEMAAARASASPSPPSTAPVFVSGVRSTGAEVSTRADRTRARKAIGVATATVAVAGTCAGVLAMGGAPRRGEGVAPVRPAPVVTDLPRPAASSAPAATASPREDRAEAAPDAGPRPPVLVLHPRGGHAK